MNSFINGFFKLENKKTFGLPASHSLHFGLLTLIFTVHLSNFSCSSTTTYLQFSLDHPPDQNLCNEKHWQFKQIYLIILLINITNQG